jgi:CBS domain-containing protein
MNDDFQVDARANDRSRSWGRACLTVRDVMTSGVVSAYEDAPFKEIAGALIRNRIGAVPILDNERRVVGVVSESDLLTRVSPQADPPRSPNQVTERFRVSVKRATTARELMSEPAVTTTLDTPIAVAAQVAQRAGVQRLPVVNVDGTLIGIVSRADLRRVFLRDDDAISYEIEALVRHPSMGLDPTGIEVRVEAGVVTLRGQAETRLLTAELVRRVLRLSGVVDVVDRLAYFVDDDYRPEQLR